MALISRTLPSLLQGMSQQSAEMRHPTQGDIQKNAISHPTHGLGKRTGTDHIITLASIPTTLLWATWIARDRGEKYVVIYDGSRLRVYGLSGREFHVDYSTVSARNYLQSTNPRKHLRSLTLNDTTLILNRDVQVAMTSDVSQGEVNKAIIWIKQGSYGCDYSFEIEGQVYNYTTDDSNVTTLRTNWIASQLKAMYDASPQAGYTVTYTTGDSFLFVEKTNGEDFDITVRDSLNGSGIGSAKHFVKSFADLPPAAPDQFVLKVLGSPGDSDDDYWVYFDANREVTSDGLKRGEWVESVAPSTAYRLDKTTMPHRLDRLQDDSTGTITGVPYGVYFRFGPVTWEDRLVGSNGTTPQPSFVGNRVHAMTVHQNRLVFVFKSNLVMSRTGDLFNWWPRSVTRVSDDDRIDYTGVGGKMPDGQALDLQHTISFAEKLVLIGNRGQVVIHSEGALTPTSIRATVALSVEADPDCQPVAVESSAFIPYSTGAYTSVREVFTTGSDKVLDEQKISEAVPRLMLGNPIRMAACPSESTLIVQGDANLSLLYVYRWLDVNNQRAQSSWGWWAMAGDVAGRILSFDVLGSTLWMLIKRNDIGLVLESLELEPYNKTERSGWPIMLDRKIAIGTTDMRVAGCPVVWEDYEVPDYGGEEESGFGAGSTGSGSGDASQQSSSGSSSGTGSSGEIPSGGIGPSIPAGPGTEVDPTVPVDPPDPVDPTGGLNPWSPNTGAPPTLPSSPGGFADPDVCNPNNDLRERATVSYDPVEDTTTIALPYPPTSRFLLVRSDTMQIVPWRKGNGERVIVVDGDYTGHPMYGGIDYEFRWRFGPAILSKHDASGGLGVIRTGRLQVIRWAVNHNYSGPFDFEIYREGELLRTESVVPRKLGTVPLNRPVEGRQSSVVLGPAKDCRVDIASRSPWPSWFSSASWEADFQQDFQAI